MDIDSPGDTKRLIPDRTASEPPGAGYSLERLLTSSNWASPSGHGNAIPGGFKILVNRDGILRHLCRAEALLYCFASPSAEFPSLSRIFPQGQNPACKSIWVIWIHEDASASGFDNLRECSTLWLHDRNAVGHRLQQIDAFRLIVRA